MSDAPARTNYHPDIRNAVVASGDPTLFDDIPESTQRTWLRRGPANVVSMEPDASHLILRVQRLEAANRRLRNIIRLLLALTRAFGFTLSGHRMPSAKGKRTLMRAVDRASETMPRRHALRVLGLTPSRWTAWQQASAGCALEDLPSCPRSRPTRLSAREVMAIRQLVTSEGLWHMPIRALALFAQRKDLVHVAVGTWYRLIRERGWRRPRRRVHPPSPTVGLRATRPGQYLHIDVTVFRLLDGSTAYLQAIIDNFSRCILAHAVSTTKTAAETAALIGRATAVLGRDAAPTVVADDGSECRQDNAHIAAALGDADASMLVAQSDILASNSMIERLWMSMKHNFLFTHDLSSVGVLRRLVDFYVDEHNHEIPHSAFAGRTPAEVFHGEAANVPALLASKRTEARQVRLDENRRTRCGACAPPSSDPGRVR